jgi:microcystin-dependent protein
MGTTTNLSLRYPASTDLVSQGATNIQQLAEDVDSKLGTVGTFGTGDLKLTVLASAPAGWLLCDGSAVSRATYGALYTALGGSGSPYGQGDGSTTFNVPDYRGRSPVGKGTHADVSSLGATDGLAVGSRTPKWSHSHTINDHTHAGVDHLHDMSHGHGVADMSAEYLRLDFGASHYAAGSNAYNHNHAYSVNNFSGSTGGADRSLTTGGASNRGTDAQPYTPGYAVVNYLIKT